MSDNITIEFKGVEGAIAALQTLAAGEWTTDALREQIQAFSDAERQYFTEVVNKLPFKRPPNPLRAYGIESGALSSDLFNNWVAEGGAIGTGSDLVYADYQEELAEAKGSSLFLPDEQVFDLAEAAINAAIDAIWSN